MSTASIYNPDPKSDFYCLEGMTSDGSGAGEDGIWRQYITYDPANPPTRSYKSSSIQEWVDFHGGLWKLTGETLHIPTIQDALTFWKEEKAADTTEKGARKSAAEATIKAFEDRHRRAIRARTPTYSTGSVELRTAGLEAFISELDKDTLASD